MISIKMIIVFILLLLLLLVEVLVHLAGFRLHPTVELADHELLSQDLAEVYLSFDLLCLGELSLKMGYFFALADELSYEIRHQQAIFCCLFYKLIDQFWVFLEQEPELIFEVLHLYPYVEQPNSQVEGFVAGSGESGRLKRLELLVIDRRRQSLKEIFIGDGWLEAEHVVNDDSYPRLILLRQCGFDYLRHVLHLKRLLEDYLLVVVIGCVFV